MPTIQARETGKLVRSDNTADKTENIWFKKIKIVVASSAKLGNVLMS